MPSGSKTHGTRLHLKNTQFLTPSQVDNIPDMKYIINYIPTKYIT